MHHRAFRTTAKTPTDLTNCDSRAAPTPISDLVLRTTSNTLNASWNSANGDTFDVELWLDGERVGPIYSVSTAEKPFVGLKAAANYAVRVSAVTGHLRSLPKEASAFTSESASGFSPHSGFVAINVEDLRRSFGRLGHLNPAANVWVQIPSLYDL